MEPKPTNLNKKTFKKSLIKKILIIVGIVLLVGIVILEIYSPIFINNFEDLDPKAESERVGGEFFENNGDQMYFADYNSKKENVLLMIHGFGANSFSWKKNINGLADDYRIITVDLLGFGMSKNTKSNDIGLDRDVEVLSAFIKDKKLKNITIVGHSMGGVVSQKLALMFPNEVLSLVLINSLDASAPDNQNRFFNGLLSFPLIKNPFGYFLYSNLISNGVKKAYYNEKDIDHLITEGYQKGFRYKGSLDQLIKFSQSSQPKAADISQIKQLTLIYSSDNDNYVNPEIQKNISSKIPNSKLVKITQAGHLLMEEQPALVNEGIDTWVKQALEKRNIG